VIAEVSGYPKAMPRPCVEYRSGRWIPAIGTMPRFPAPVHLPQPVVVHTREALREGLRLVESGETSTRGFEAVHTELLLAGFLLPRKLSLTRAGERFLRRAA
jgi:hypothetical protein